MFVSCVDGISSSFKLFSNKYLRPEYVSSSEIGFKTTLWTETSCSASRKRSGDSQEGRFLNVVDKKFCFLPGSLKQISQKVSTISPINFCLLLLVCFLSCRRQSSSISVMCPLHKVPKICPLFQPELS